MSDYKNWEPKSPLGIGFRACHFGLWPNLPTSIAAEVLVDNFMFQQGGPGQFHLEKMARNRNIVMHGIGLGIANRTPLNMEYLDQWKALITKWHPLVVSDHLCLTSNQEKSSFDLLPFVYSKENLHYVANRICFVQDHLGVRFSLENISRYVAFKHGELTECQFLAELSNLTGCAILLDVNNLIVTERNLGEQAKSQLNYFDAEMIAQYHVSGHTETPQCYIDSHDQLVKTSVWELLGFAAKKFGKKVVILERDDEPSMDELLGELKVADAVLSPIWKDMNVRSDVKNLKFASPLQKTGNRKDTLKLGSKETQTLELYHSAQETFFGEVTGLPWKDQVQEKLKTILVDDLPTRVQDGSMVYKNSYYSRITKAVPDSFFKDVSEIYGETWTQAKIGKFMALRGSSGPLLYNIMPDFMVFLNEFETDLPLGFAEACKYCMVRWEVMISSDPEPAVSFSAAPELFRIALQRNCRVIQSQVALCNLIRSKSAASAGTCSQSLLLFKESEFQVSFLLIPDEFIKFTKILSGNVFLGEAIASLQEVSFAPGFENRFGSWIQTLAREKLFVLKC